jgi:hypothetical protein
MGQNLKIRKGNFCEILSTRQIEIKGTLISQCKFNKVVILHVTTRRRQCVVVSIALRKTKSNANYLQHHLAIIINTGESAMLTDRTLMCGSRVMGVMTFLNTIPPRQKRESTCTHVTHT